MTSHFQRLLLVSVGTSIYTSLCWKPEAFPASSSYKDWVKSSDLLSHPRLRTRNSELEDLVFSTLKENNAVQIAKNLDLTNWKSSVFRYSAELTTVMKLACLRADNKKTEEEWIRQSEIVCLTDEAIGKSRIAGIHLIELIKQWANIDDSHFDRIIRVNGLESEDVHLFTKAQPNALNLAQKLAREYLENTKEVFYIASGGFKITAFLAGLLLPESKPQSPLYLVYQHEDNKSMVILVAERPALYSIDLINNTKTELTPIKFGLE